jgi:hypothetical protein
VRPGRDDIPARLQMSNFVTLVGSGVYTRRAPYVVAERLRVDRLRCTR